MSLISDALNGKPLVVFTPAKRGDLALVEETHSAVSLAGGTTRTTVHRLTRVANTTRDGRVTAVERMFYGKPLLGKPRDGVTLPCLIVSQSKVDAPAAFAALGACEFSSVDAAREAVRHFCK